MKTIGKYQVLQEIGRSAAGATYRVRDPFRKRELALKVLSPLAALSAEATDRLYRHLSACEELSHRHVARIHDLGEVEGGVYIATYLLAGSDLRTHLAGPAAPISQQLTLLAQVCEGLSFAHAKGIAHGNLKPSNIFVVDGRDAAILDFGVGCWQSLLISAGARLNGLLPNYLAPEQILGQDFDTRSDLFSLAVVVYQMLAGRYPFEAPSGVIPREIVHSDPKPLRELNALIPEELEQTLVRALKKDPKERLETANELAASLYASALALRRQQPAPVDGSAGGSDAGKTESAAPAPSAAPQPSPSELLALASATGTLAPVDIAETAPAPAGITAPAPVPQPVAPEPTVQPEPVAVALTTSSETAPELQSAFAFPPSAETPAASSAQVVAPQPPPVIPEPPAAPAAQTPPPAPAGQWPSPVGSTPAVQPAPRKTNKSISLGRRIFVVAVAAALAIWAMATIISRQNLNASQDKPAEPAVQAPSAPAPAAPPTAPELPPAQVQSTPSSEAAPAPKKVENPAPRPEQILRVQVKALWEAGRYSEAMRLVDGVLQENPGNAEAQGWKTRIRSAQDAEAAMK